MKKLTILMFMLTCLRLCGASLAFSELETVPPPWLHRNNPGIVLEVCDSGDIISDKNCSGKVNLLATNHGSSDVELDFTLTLFLQDTNRSVAHLKEKSLIIPAGGKTTAVRTYTISLEPEELAFLNNSKYAMQTLKIRLEAKDKSGNKIKLLNSEGHIGITLSSRKAELPKSEIVNLNGIPTLKINDQYYPGIFGYIGWNWGPARQSIKDSGQTGRHIYEIVYQPWTLWKDGNLSTETLERKMNEMFSSIIAHDPEALIFVRYWLYVPREWSSLWSDETIRFDDRSNSVELLGGPWAHASYASEIWKEQYSKTLREITAKMMKSPYADRIFMVRVGYGNCGEWNNFGYHANKLPDYSTPMQKKYRQWLEAKYNTVDHLNSEWKTEFKNWNEINIPSKEERLDASNGLLVDLLKSSNYSKYHEFFSELTVELINHFGKIVKDESNSKLLYGVFYGYFAHHLTCPPYHSLDSGHYAMGKLLRSDYVDSICSPYNYHDRQKNIGFGMPLESIKLHNKLFLVEADLPTHSADPARYADKKQHFSKTPEDTLTYYWRDYAKIVCKGISGYWYDFAHHWYEFDEFKDLMRDIQKNQSLLLTSDRSSVADVAVILDEPSVFLLSANSKDFGNALFRNLAYNFDEAAAAWDCFLSTDLDYVISKNYKLIIFTNMFKADEKQAELLKKYHGSILWLAGAGQNGKGENSSFSGIKIRTNYSTEAGTKKPLSYADDKTAEILKQDESKRCILARKTINDSTVYYSSLPELSTSELREIYQAAGVHIYSSSANTFISADKSFISMWMPDPDGESAFIKLPAGKYSITDMKTGRKIKSSDGVFTIKTQKSKAFSGLYHIEKEAETSLLQRLLGI